MEITSLLNQISGEPQRPESIALPHFGQMANSHEMRCSLARARSFHDAWFMRLKRVCKNHATHSIEIQSLEIDHFITRQYFFKIWAKMGLGNGPGKLELSVWTLLVRMTITTTTTSFRPKLCFSWSGTSLMRTLNSKASISGSALWLAHLASQPSTHSLDCPESADNLHDSVPRDELLPWRMFCNLQKVRRVVKTFCCCSYLL